MNNFQEGKKLFAMGDLSGSFESLKLFLSENLETSSVEDCVEAAKIIVNVAHSEKIKMSEYIDVVAQSFMRGSYYQSALEILEEFVSVKENKVKEKHLSLLIECAKNIGSVKKERLYLLELINFLLKKGSVDKVLSDQSRFVNDLLLAQAHIKAFNIQAIEEMIDNDKLDVTYIAKVIELVSKNSSYWNKSSKFRNWVISHLNSDVLSIKINKKYVLKLLHDHFHQGGEIDLSNLIKICERWRLFSLGYESSLLAKDSAKEDYFLINTPNELMKDEEFDFGNDLLASVAEKKVEDEKNELDQETVSNYGNVEDLLKEIRTLTVKNESHDKNESLKVFIGDNKISFLRENYNDLIAGLNMLGEYELSKKTLENFLNDKNIDTEDKIDINYLLVETLLAQRNYFEAEKVINDVLFRFPLSEDKRVTFLYLKGDVYFLQGKKESAYQYFKIVSDERPSYRLVYQRLREIENA